MTWLGKIFALLVLVLSVATVWFITTTWVTRTNWRVQALEYKDAYTKSVDARKTEYESYRSEVESLRGQISALETKLTSAQATQAAAEKENTTNRDIQTKTVANLAGLTKIGIDSDTKIQVAQKAHDEATARSVLLENENAIQLVARTRAEAERVAAESARKRAEGIADMQARRLDELNSLVAELKQSGGNPTDLVKKGLGINPVAVPENLRGTVTHVQDKDPQTGIQGELVQISLGLDAGLQRGAVLELSRENGTGKYLGTVVIDQVWPKYAVGVFRPSDPTKPLRRLKADEFPKVNDTVKVQDAHRTTRVNP
jgi:hypothetical protein